MNEPNTFKDLNFMIDTSSKGWFNGGFKRESVNTSCERQVGDVVDVEYCVRVNRNSVKIVKCTHSVSEKTGKFSYSCNVKDETLDVYNSMDEFKNSKWYDQVVTAFADGDSDASWLDSVEVDEKLIDCTDTWTGYDEYTYVSMGIANTYKDFFNNNRIAKGSKQLSLNVSRMSGSFTISDGCQTLYDVTVDDLKKAMDLYEKLKNMGAEVHDSYVKFPISGEEGTNK